MLLRLLLAICFVLTAVATGQRPLRPCDNHTLYVGESTSRGRTWPGGVVPYEFAPNTTAVMRNAMLAAFREWESVAAVRFVARAAEADWIYVQDSNANNSFVGRIGGRQTINIVSWSVKFVLVHELGHALGLEHEHQRPDRDNFITVNVQNVSPSFLFAFSILPNANTSTPYDFDSVMHYEQFAFSANFLPTITVKPPNQGWQNRIGQTTHLSQGDARGMRALYGAPAPVITALRPDRVTSWQPGTVSIVGHGLSGITSVRLGGTSVPSFTVVSPTQLDFTAPSPFPIGTHQVTASDGTVSTALPLAITGNDPPVITGTTVVQRGVPARVDVHSDARLSVAMFASPSSAPSVVPGIVSLAIGQDFAQLISIGAVAADATGTASLPLLAPPTLLPGLRLFFEGIPFDPADPTGPSLPLVSTGAHTTIIF